MKKVLILLSSPQDKNTPPLELDRELYQVEQSLKHAIKCDSFEVLIRWAARVEDLRRELLREKPQIVHFSGHGAGSQGLILETETRQKQFVSSEALAELFELCKDYVECVLLNACYSDVQAIAIHRHIDYVIGMNQAILDRAAIQFAIGFYDGLAAGRSYEDAYRLGCNAIALQGIKDATGKAESLTPVLKARRWRPAQASTSTDNRLPENQSINKDMADIPQEKTSQSIAISGGTISGQVAQAGRDITQSQQINQGSNEKPLSPTDVVELIGQLETLFKGSELSENQKNRAITHLEAAKEATKEKEPDKDYAAKSLQKATKILKETNETIEAGQGLWKKIEPILKQILPWLGITSQFFGF
jgi:hypothetical protein